MSVFTNSSARSIEEAKAYTAAIIDLLGSQKPLDVMQATEKALEDAVSGMTRQDIARPEAKGKWSALQVLQHLADSELVWGYRLRMILAHDRPAITGYDQDLWADRLHYGEADPAQAIREFGVLRRANLKVLKRASADDLKRVGVHAERGEESLEHLIRLLAGHDILHLRQIARIRRTVDS